MPKKTNDGIKGGGAVGVRATQKGEKRGREGTGSTYKIKPRQRANAKKLGVVIMESADKTKKIDVFEPLTKAQIAFNKRNVGAARSGKDYKMKRLASIGGMYQDGTPYGDYATFLQKPQMVKTGKPIVPEERRKNYLQRHSLEPKEKVNTKGKTIKTPSYYADKILWD
tara:strand:- start:743 stop:1246 length:504 start_codon:yes stop_codon:yes gene_type:complete